MSLLRNGIVWKYVRVLFWSFKKCLNMFQGGMESSHIITYCLNSSWGSLPSCSWVFIEKKICSQVQIKFFFIIRKCRAFVWSFSDLLMARLKKWLQSFSDILFQKLTSKGIKPIYSSSNSFTLPGSSSPQ